MRVIPVRSRLIESRELVVERVTWDDGTLVDTNGPICPCRAFLEKSVPMLNRQNLDKKSSNIVVERAYNAGADKHRGIV